MARLHLYQDSANLSKVFSLTHNVHQQLLAGLADAPQSDVHIFLARQAVHAVVQGV